MTRFSGLYREGPRVEAARRRRAELVASREKLDDVAYARARALDTVKGYEAYLAEYPDGRHAAAARQKIRDLDDAAYAKARRLDTVEAYEGYLAAFPGGVHGQAARERMWQLGEAGLGLEHADRVGIQRGLVTLGKNVGQVDGVFGERDAARHSGVAAGEGNGGDRVSHAGAGGGVEGAGSRAPRAVGAGGGSSAAGGVRAAAERTGGRGTGTRAFGARGEAA